MRPPPVALLSNCKFDTLALGKGDPGLLAANDKNVALPSGESIVNGVLKVDDAKAAIVALTVGNDTDTAHVTTTSDHGDSASVELDEVRDLSRLKVNLDSVVDLNQGVREADAAKPALANKGTFFAHTNRRDPASIAVPPQLGPMTLPKLGPTADRCPKNLRSRIMRNQEWHTTTAELDTLDLSQLVLGLLFLDPVDREAALGVVDQAEVLAGLLNRDDVHEAGGVGDVGADLAVDLDETLVHDGLGLAVVERILEAVADEDDQRHAVAELVRTSRGPRGIGTRQLVEEPVRRRAQALLVLLPVSHTLASQKRRRPMRCCKFSRQARRDSNRRNRASIVKSQEIAFQIGREPRTEYLRSSGHLASMWLSMCWSIGELRGCGSAAK